MSARSNARRILRTELILRFDNICHYCSERCANGKIPTIEHVVPVSFGGTDDDYNLVLACEDCNSERGNLLFYCECALCSKAYSEFSAALRSKIWLQRSSSRWVITFQGKSTYLSKDKKFEDAIKYLDRLQRFYALKFGVKFD